MRKIFLSTVLALYSLDSSAITMEEALISGYDNNEELKIIRNDFLNEIEAFPRAVASFLPRLSARFDSNDSKVVRRNPDASFPDRTSGNINSTVRSFVLEQPIFDGWSSVSSIRAAQHSFRSSRASYYAKEQDSILKQIENYLTAFETEENLKISKISVKANRTQLRSVKEKYRLGESTQTDVASAAEGLATAEADEAFAYAKHQSSKANFYQVFGVESDNVKMPEMPQDLPPSLQILTERALLLNPAIESASYRKYASKSTENATKGNLLPTVKFRVENNRTYYSPQDVLRTRYNNTSTTSTLSANVPILAKGGEEYSDVRRAKYQTKDAFIKYDNIVKTIKSECRAKWTALEAAKSRVKATNQAVKAGEVAYEGVIQEERYGSKTIVDVLSLEVRLNDARRKSVAAKKDLILAAYQIKSLLGELTAKSMKLKVDYFEPEKEFKKVKMKFIGF